MRVDHSRISPMPAPNFGWCVAEHASSYGVDLDPAIVMLLSSSIWLGVVRDGCAVFPDLTAVGAAEHLSGLNPRAMEMLADALRAPIVPFRQRDPGQFVLLRQRASAGRRTLTVTSARLFDAAAPRDRHAFALVSAIRGDGASETVDVKGGAQLERTVPSAEFLAHWVSAALTHGEALESAWYVWVPARPNGRLDDGEARAALLATALARQLLVLTDAHDDAPVGVALLRALLDQAMGGDAATHAAHVALLAGATSRVDAVGGPALSRRAVATALAQLQSFDSRELDPLVSTLHAAAEVWDDVTEAAASGSLQDSAMLCAAYRRLIEVERALVTTLAATLSLEEAAC